MRSPTTIEIEYLRKWLSLDIRDSNKTYMFLYILPTLICLTVFWAFFLSTHNEQASFFVFIISLSIILFSVLCAEYYRRKKLESIDLRSAPIIQISGTPHVTHKETFDENTSRISVHTYHIGSHEIYLPMQWMSLGIGKVDQSVTAEVCIAPWGKAFPVSINNYFSLEKEATCNSRSISPVNIFWSVISVVTLFLSSLAQIPSLTGKTAWPAPIEAYRMISTIRQQTDFGTVWEALSYRLQPYQPIAIKNAIILPVPKERFETRKAVVADRPAFLPELITQTRNTIRRDFQLQTNLRFSGHLKDTLKPSTLIEGDSIPVRIDGLCQSLDFFCRVTYRTLSGGFITDDQTYPDRALYTDEYHPPSLQAFPAVLSYLDTLTHFQTVKGILIPRTVNDRDSSRFGYSIDQSRENYSAFSLLLLTILPVVSLIALAVSILQALRNAAISKKVQCIYSIKT